MLLPHRLLMIGALLLTCTARAFADDYGPQAEVRAIRRDLPIITSWAHGNASDIVVLNDSAVAAYDRQLFVMTRRYGRWWLENSGDCPATQDYLESLGATRQLAELALRRAPATKTDVYPVSQREVASAAVLGGGGSLCNAYGDPDTNQDTIASNTEFKSSDEGYRLKIDFAETDAAGARIAARGRMPTAGESWAAQGGDGYYFLSAMISSERPIHISAGTVVEVAFPFALESNKKYTFTIAHADKPIEPIEGTLKDNTLHFELPAFVVQPGAHLMGEIDGG